MSKNIFITNTIEILVEDGKERKNKNEFPKSILALFLTAQLLFGIDFGFSSIFKKKHQSIVKRFTFFLSIVMIILIISPVVFDEVFYWFNIIEYTSYYLLLNLTKYNAYHFINDMNKIYDLNQYDKKFLRIVGVYYHGAEFFMKATFIVILYKLGNVSFFSLNNITYTIIYYVPCLGLDIIGIVQVVLMYYVNCSVRHLKALLGANDVNFKNIENYYINIAFCYDKIKTLYGRIVSTFFC